jgi:hopanoid biosynthesis associated RND transporter like protein HpnN
MKKTAARFLIALIHRWEANFMSHPWLVILFFLCACGLSLWYTLENLTVNTNTADMISTDVPFQKNRIRLESAFPQDVSTILLLVEGQTPEDTKTAVERVGLALRHDSAHFSAVYIPDEGDFFARNGLLYLSVPELEALSTQLANAQPFIGRIAGDNSLRGLFGILGQALTEGEQHGIDLDLKPLLGKVREAVTATTAGQPYRVSWQQLMSSRQSGLGVTKRFILATPILNFSEMQPAEQAIAAVDRIVADTTQGELASVVIRKTGEVVLEHEEMQTIGIGMGGAGLASLILVSLTLWFAYRSFKLMFATTLTLTMGLIFSLGFATAAIGQLNLISIGFAVLFIGMGDAYSSHFCLRYRELILRGQTDREALLGTLTSTGSALILSAITGALGLFAFIPTKYSGVAELGVIAGTSMFIALATTFTVLPALMRVMPIHPRQPKVSTAPQKRSGFSSNWPLRYARPVQAVTIILALVSLKLLGDVQIDFNPINLRDQNTESVKTFKYLLKSEDTTPMTLASLASNAEQAKARKARFEQLPTVDRVVSIFDLVPEDQDEKLALIADLSLVMGTQLENFPPIKPGGATLAAVEKFQDAVQTRLKTAGDDGVLGPLDQALTQFRQKLEAAPTPETQQILLDRLQTSLLDPLPPVIADLRKSLDAQPISFETLPKHLVERWISADGLYRLQIFPKKDLNDLENLREFILDAQKVDPDVTDLPVTYLESMNEVMIAFQQAFGIAFGLTTVILLIVLRNIKDTLLVLLPLLLASLFTAATTVLVGVPFNFANIIALPLLFGLGVDSGIHMAHRLHYLRSNEENLLSSSEARGVLYGSLTTVFSFSSLAFTSHQGTASMGLLLAIGLLLTLICALVVLPAFSTLRVPRPQ